MDREPSKLGKRLISAPLLICAPCFFNLAELIKEDLKFKMDSFRGTAYLHGHRAATVPSTMIHMFDVIQ